MENKQEEEDWHKISEEVLTIIQLPDDAVSWPWAKTMRKIQKSSRGRKDLVIIIYTQNSVIEKDPVTRFIVWVAFLKMWN